MTVQERINSIKSHCEDSQVAFRQDNERIAFVVPKRNIETWLEYLRGNDVDETTAYSKYANPGDCGPDVALLDEMCRQKKLRATPPPSLMSACAEFARL